MDTKDLNAVPQEETLLTILIDLIQEDQNEMLEIMMAKNADYANGDVGNNPFANFLLCEKMGTCSAEQGMVVRMSDKLQRVSNLLTKKAAVADESIDDTLLDAANYALLLKALRRMRRMAIWPEADRR